MGPFYACERYKIKNYVLFLIVFIYAPRFFAFEPLIYHVMYEDCLKKVIPKLSSFQALCFVPLSTRFHFS